MKRELHSVMKAQGLEHLMLSNKQIREQQAMTRITRFVTKYMLRRRTHKLHSQKALLIQRMWRGRRVKNGSFFDALELPDSRCLLFLKEQRSLFLRLMERVLPAFP